MSSESGVKFRERESWEKEKTTKDWSHGIEAEASEVWSERLREL